MPKTNANNSFFSSGIMIYPQKSSNNDSVFMAIVCIIFLFWMWFKLMLPDELIMYHFILRRSVQSKHWNQLLLLLPIFPNILISSIIMSKKYICNYTVCNLNNDCICQQPQVTKVFIVDMRYAIRCWPIVLKFLGLFPNPWCND